MLKYKYKILFKKGIVMKKRIALIALSLLLVLTSFSFVSCDNLKKVDSIDGLTPGEAYEKALVLLEDVDRYDVHLDMKSQAKILFVPVYTIEVENFCYYSYDGKNQHYEIPDGSLEMLEEHGLSDVMSGFDEAIWYVDGICYVKNGNVKEKFESSYNPIQRSDYETAVSNILRKHRGETQCYRDGDRYYFTVVITDPAQMELNMGTDNELYTVYLTEDGYVDEIIFEGTMKGFVHLTIAADYSYEDAPKVTPPSDAHNYVTKSSSYGY